MAKYFFYIILLYKTAYASYRRSLYQLITYLEVLRYWDLFSSMIFFDSKIMSVVHL